MMYATLYQSPIGNLELVEENGVLIRVVYLSQEEREKECLQSQTSKKKLLQAASRKEIELRSTPILEEAVRQLEEYFSGVRKEFQLPLDLRGTEFQKKVWQALLEIPYGETQSYGQIAEQIGNPKAMRAVGMANHNNPIMIIVPCHRVIGKDRSMTGYACGIDVKEALLRLERSL